MSLSSLWSRFSSCGVGRCATGTLRQARRAVVLVIGCTLFLAGVAMVFLPGPAIVVIPLALAVLATEFVWAKRLLARFNSNFRNMRNNFRKPSRERREGPSGRIREMREGEHDDGPEHKNQR